MKVATKPAMGPPYRPVSRRGVDTSGHYPKPTRGTPKGDVRLKKNEERIMLAAAAKEEAAALTAAAVCARGPAGNQAKAKAHVEAKARAEAARRAKLYEQLQLHHMGIPSPRPKRWQLELRGEHEAAAPYFVAHEPPLCVTREDVVAKTKPVFSPRPSSAPLVRKRGGSKPVEIS